VNEVWLGLIALAVLTMAIVQIVVGLQLLKVAKDAAATMQEFRTEVRPLIQKAHKVADDAGRVSAMALTQVERVDQLMATTAMRVDDTLQIVQESLIAPVKQGAAVMAGLKAAVAVFRARQDKGRYGRDDEDALFIG
jgi:malonyl CoA-acyl carrier protein transacylase